MKNKCIKKSIKFLSSLFAVGILSIPFTCNIIEKNNICEDKEISNSIGVNPIVNYDNPTAVASKFINGNNVAGIIEYSITSGTNDLTIIHCHNIQAENIVFNEEIKLQDSSGIEQTYFLKDIDVGAFVDSANIIGKIIFPSTLKSIGKGAFLDCIKLTSIDLSKCTSLTSIGNDAFKQCYQLSNVIFSTSLSNIGEFAFDRDPLVNVDLNNNSYFSYAKGVGNLLVTGNTGEWDYEISPIGSIAYGNINLSNDDSSIIKCPNFCGCAGITTVILSKYFSEFDSNNFSYCQIESVDLNDNNNLIFAKNVGNGKVLLDKKIFPTGEWNYINNNMDFTIVANIAYGDIDLSNYNGTELSDDYDHYYVFDIYLTGCSGIKSINFSTKINYIDNSMINDLYKLEFINLDNFKWIASDNFNNCFKLPEINLRSFYRNNVVFDANFCNCFSLKKIYFPRSMFTIAILNPAFTNCRHISNIYFSWNTNELFFLIYNFDWFNNVWLKNAVGEENMNKVSIHVPINTKTLYLRYASNLGIEGCKIVEDEQLSNNLPLILGLSLGLGIPAFAGVITAIAIGIKNNRLKKSISRKKSKN